jgi:hypothetical protein
MQWARPETFEGQHGMLPTLLARPGPSHMSPRTNSVRQPMRSRPHVLPHPKARARPQGDSSANGSVTSSRRPFASSCLTTSVCGTTSAGQRLTAERAWASASANVRICRIARAPLRRSSAQPHVERWWRCQSGRALSLTAHMRPSRSCFFASNSAWWRPESGVNRRAWFPASWSG